jgi:hypothetical protein
VFAEIGVLLPNMTHALTGLKCVLLSKKVVVWTLRVLRDFSLGFDAHKSAPVTPGIANPLSK